MKKEDVLSFIKTRIHAVISTIDEKGRPESALIGFTETDQLEIFFGTFNTSRKYKNLQKNKQVALVIGWTDDSITVQYEGLAEEVDKKDVPLCISLLQQKIPSSIKFSTLPQQTYFKVTPTWIRYSDLSSSKEKIVEFT